MNKNSEMRTQNIKQTCNNYVKLDKILYVFNLMLLIIDEPIQQHK